MAAAVGNIGYLSTYLHIPQPTLHSFVDAPTAELVKLVLEAITAKAHEHEEVRSDKIRLEIELENAVRSSESRSQGLKATVEKALNDVNELREKLNSEENERAALESELLKLKSSSSTSSSEVDSLRLRITTLEASNRDTVAVLESKSTVNDSLAQDLQKQHQKGLELSQQINALQQVIQNSNSAASSARFREQNLNQELEQAKRNNEWFETELKTKTAEALKYRKEKGARIAELQRLNDESTANLESSKRTEVALRSRFDEVQKKAEEYLLKVQQLQEAAASTEESFRQELESSRRLAELQAQQTETHRNRLKEVEASLEKVRDDANEEISRCRQEAEVGGQERERLENRVEELEAENDRLEATASQPYPGSVPGTPRQGLNGSLIGGAGSPGKFGTPGSARNRSTITATQAIEELYKVKGQLATERRRNERLSVDMEEMMRGLEAKQPEIEELQAEHERLQQEVVEMSKFVDETGKERDSAKKDAQRAKSEASTAAAESNILRQQLRDLSAQLKMLLWDLAVRERGLESFSLDERAELERLARGEVSENALEGLTDTDQFISQRLTVFRSISDLQEKNQELLKITRQLGAQMESEEALAAKHQAAKDHQQVQELEKRIENYQDELNNVIIRSESYIKERDMFRRMLQHRGQLPVTADLASVFGQSADSNILVSTEQSPNGKDTSNYATLLRELQSHFDQYREEQTVDRRTLKEQADKLATEKSSLQFEIARMSSQLTFSNERYEMLQANYSMLQNENAELQKRSRLLSESAAKQDLRTQQVAEDLIEARGIVESMRNENANLKAEKKLWKDIHDRLNQDNEGLINERSRLNNLIADQQSLQNERELSESETRRRLQTQVESLETELSATKRKLSDEMEDNKKAQLRKEYDTQQNQKRIDDLVSTLSSLREELVAAKTTRDHLQTRVDELSIELKSAEERVEVLQPRPTPRPGTQVAVEAGHDEALSREQELAIQVSELKRDLELAKSEVESSKSQMEQYKAISQASEEELQSLNETQDQYRQEMDAIIEAKNSQIRQLEQRIEDISGELSTTNNELNTVRSQHGEIMRTAAVEKAALETEIARLRDEDERHSTAAQLHQQDLRAQAEIAARAQQDYEYELVKHAEAAKILQNLRAEHNQLRTESAALKAEADSAKVTLSQSQVSWEERREQFEKELGELRTRRDDINAQNKLLLQQLESVSSQVTTMQQGRATFADGADSGTPSAETDRSVEGLRELITYLRRDKEIVDVQYELSVQEAKRLRQQLEYAQSQMDEARLKLDQERRSQADGSRSSLAHKDLMEKLNELNLFRESSITLRNEARQAQAQLSDKTRQVEELLVSIQPLEIKVQELENTKEMQDGEIRLLQEDRDRWQKRNQEILSKYDRIDPAEMEQLKDTLATTKIERDSLAAEQQPLQEKLQTLEAEKATWASTRQRLVDQAKERARTLTKERNERTAERDTVIGEKEALEQQFSTIQQNLETVIQEKQAAERQLTTVKEELSNARSETQRAPNGTINSITSAVVPSTVAAVQSNGELDKQLANLRKDLENAVQQRQEAEQQITTLREELGSMRSERDQALATAANAATTNAAKDSAIDNGVEEGQIDESPRETLPDAEREALEARITAAETRAQEEAAKAKRIEENMEVTVKQRSEKMKDILNKKLVASKETQKAELEAEYKTRLEQDKQIWLAEQKTSAPTPPPYKPSEGQAASVPPTPSTLTGRPAPVPLDLANVTDQQLRDLVSTHPAAKAIIQNNLKKAAQKEVSQSLAEAEKKAEEAKSQAVSQAVLMANKKGALQLNMAQNKERLASAKIQVVESAAKETPQKPVAEVWEVAKNAKPPPPHTAPPSSIPAVPPLIPAISTAAAAATLQAPQVSLETKSEPPTSSIPQPQVKAPSTAQTSALKEVTPQAANGTSTLPASNILAPTQPSNSAGRGSGIPRGGAPGRGGRGGGTYQAPRGGGGGSIGRGRGAQMNRGGGALNASAQNFSPGAGNKHPRDESQVGQGSGGKRVRGGGGAMP